MSVAATHLLGTMLGWDSEQIACSLYNLDSIAVIDNWLGSAFIVKEGSPLLTSVAISTAGDCDMIRMQQLHVTEGSQIKTSESCKLCNQRQ